MGALKGEFYRRLNKETGEYEPTPSALRQRRIAACHISQLPNTGQTWAVHLVAEGLLCSNAAHPAIIIPDEGEPYTLTEPSAEAFSPMDYVRRAYKLSEEDDEN